MGQGQEGRPGLVPHTLSGGRVQPVETWSHQHKGPDQLTGGRAGREHPALGLPSGRQQREVSQWAAQANAPKAGPEVWSRDQPPSGRTGVSGRRAPAWEHPPRPVLLTLQATPARSSGGCTHGCAPLQHSLPHPACRPGTPGQRCQAADLQGAARGRLFPEPPPQPTPTRDRAPHLRPPAPPPPHSPPGSPGSPSASARPPACSRSPGAEARLAVSTWTPARRPQPSRPGPGPGRPDAAPAQRASPLSPVPPLGPSSFGLERPPPSPASAAPGGRWPPRAPGGTGPPAPAACESVWG